MAGKKPVWVDEEAHLILKQYSKLTKTSMVEVASTLVLEKLSQLEPGAGLEQDAAEGETGSTATARPSVQKPVAVNAPQRTQKRRRKPTMPDPADGDIRYVGGIWLV